LPTPVRLRKDELAIVFASSRSASKLEQLKTLGVSRIAALDVTDDHAVEKALSDIDGLDIVVNFAGIAKSDTVASCAKPMLEQVMSVNLFGVYHVTKASLPKMIQRGGGSIVNIASIISSLKGAPGRFSYATSKGGLIAMTKSIATDLAQIAALAVHLASVEAGFMTGQTFVMDGGWTA